MDTQEFEAGDSLDLRPVDKDGGVRTSSSLPEVHDELFGLLGVECQVVISTPRHQVLNLIPVGRLIVVTDEAHHRSVVCKPDDGVGAMNSSAAIGEEGSGHWCSGRG